MTRFQEKTFSVPTTTPTKTPCAIHHFVKGECLRCGQKIVAQRIPDGGSQAKVTR